MWLSTATRGGRREPQEQATQTSLCPFGVLPAPSPFPGLHTQTPESQGWQASRQWKQLQWQAMLCPPCQLASLGPGLHLPPALGGSGSLCSARGVSINHLAHPWLRSHRTLLPNRPTE